MIVVSDTTPVISLMKAGQLKLLQQLFGAVYIPEAVYRELIDAEAFSEEIRMVQECEFLYVQKVDNGKSVSILQNFTGLDAGESETIILADEINSDVLLMDEHKGGQVAKKLGITITGTIKKVRDGKGYVQRGHRIMSFFATYGELSQGREKYFPPLTLYRRPVLHHERLLPGGQQKSDCSIESVVVLYK